MERLSEKTTRPFKKRRTVGLPCQCEHTQRDYRFQWESTQLDNRSHREHTQRDNHFQRELTQRDNHSQRKHTHRDNHSQREHKQRDNNVNQAVCTSTNNGSCHDITEIVNDDDHGTHRDRIANESSCSTINLVHTDYIRLHDIVRSSEKFNF